MVQSGNCSRNRGDGLGALAGVGQEIQTEFEKRFAGFGFAAGVFEQGWNVWQAQRDANARERSGLRHLG